MPLAKGKSNAVVSKNIKELVDDWKKDGAIGNAHPKSKREARKMAVAISLQKAGKSRGKK